MSVSTGAFGITYPLDLLRVIPDVRLFRRKTTRKLKPTGRCGESDWGGVKRVPRRFQGHVL